VAQKNYPQSIVIIDDAGSGNGDPLTADAGTAPSAGNSYRACRVCIPIVFLKSNAPAWLDSPPDGLP